MASTHTHYDTLQVARSASAEVIRAAYKSLSQRYHPDRHPSAERSTWEQRMKALNIAYAILSDPGKRGAYDAVLAASEQIQQRPHPQATRPNEMVRAPATPRTKPTPPPPAQPPAAVAPEATLPEHRSFRMTEPSKAEPTVWTWVFGCVLVTALLIRYTDVGSWVTSIDWRKIAEMKWPKWLWLLSLPILALLEALKQAQATKGKGRPNPTKATTQSSSPVGTSVQGSVRSSLHPWRRFFARMVDMALLLWFGGFVVGLFKGLMQTHWTGPVLFAASVLIAVTLESLLISSWGATPGKWLFGIKVHALDGGRLSDRAAFKRTILVCILGNVFYIPVLDLIANLMAYLRLRTVGIAWWDQLAGSYVTHISWKPLRAVLCSAAVITVVIVAYVQTAPQAVALWASQAAVQAMPQGVVQFMPQDTGLQPVDMAVACYAKGDARRLLPSSECVITVHNPNEHWFLRDVDLDVEVQAWANISGRISSWTYPLSVMVMPGETRSYPFVVTISGNPEPRSFSWSVRNVSGEFLPN